MTMHLTKTFFTLLLGACMLSCNNPSEKGKFYGICKIKYRIGCEE